MFHHNEDRELSCCEGNIFHPLEEGFDEQFDPLKNLSQSMNFRSWLKIFSVSLCTCSSISLINVIFSFSLTEDTKYIKNLQRVKKKIIALYCLGSLFYLTLHLLFGQ